MVDLITIDVRNTVPFQPVHIEQGEALPPPPDLDFPAPYEDTYP